jgi:hypothetical protein
MRVSTAPTNGPLISALASRWVWNIGEIAICRGKLKCLEKNLACCHLVYLISHMNCPGIEPGSLAKSQWLSAWAKVRPVVYDWQQFLMFVKSLKHTTPSCLTRSCEQTDPPPPHSIEVKLWDLLKTTNNTETEQNTWWPCLWNMLKTVTKLGNILWAARWTIGWLWMVGWEWCCRGSICDVFYCASVTFVGQRKIMVANFLS